MSTEKEGVPKDNPPSYGSQYPSQTPNQYGSPYTAQPQQYPQYGYNQYPSQQQQQQTTVVNTNYSHTPMTYQQPAEDYMCRAIFATLCCFWPVGIFAIMKASEARSAYARGDVASAQTNSASARQLSNIAIGVGIASLVVVAIIVGVYVGVVLSYTRYY